MTYAAYRDALLSSVVCIILLIPLRASAGPPEFSCPGELTYKKRELTTVSAIVENCRDSAGMRQGPYRFTRLTDGSLESDGSYLNDKIHGPTRYFNDVEELLYTTSFDNGVELSVQWTPVGIRTALTLANEDLKTRFRNKDISLSTFQGGDGGIALEITIKYSNPRVFSVGQAMRMRQTLGPWACKFSRMFSLEQEYNVTVIYRWSSGEVGTLEKFRPQHCRKYAHSAVSKLEP